MSRSVNEITLSGNVGRDPDIQQTKSGTKVGHFSVATKRRIPAGSEEEGRTDCTWNLASRNSCPFGNQAW